MNRFNLIIILGVTGTGKSLLASRYIASHPEARLIDSLKLHEASPAVISAFLSAENISELSECKTLIIDEVPDSLYFDALYGILSYRINKKKNVIILSQSICVVEKITDLEKMDSVSDISGIQFSLAKDSNLEFFCSCLGIMQTIRSDRPLELNLWKGREPSIIEEQDQHLTIPTEDWNELLGNSSFWELLEQSNLQSLVMNEAGESMKNGTVAWAVAENYLKAFIHDRQLPQHLRDSFSEILLWIDSEDKSSYQLGINFISSTCQE